ncbi:hypothetical protein F5X99DRAFT_413418 [Biscogniauxia marginata]|nr:hypothetical protein F5X99DRAFT_413418 [Biscogniauxia marginata]
MTFASFRYRHRHQDNAPRRPNWVKKPSLLSQDVQPAITDALEFYLREPLEGDWHSARMPLGTRVPAVLNVLPSQLKPWRAGVAEEYIANLCLILKPELVRKLTGQINRIVDDWFRKERGGAEIQRCQGRAFHPRVVFFNMTISILEHICERCEKEYPPGVDHWEPVGPVPAPSPVPVSPLGDQHHHQQQQEDNDDSNGGTGLHKIFRRRPRRPSLGPIELPPRKLLWVNTWPAVGPPSSSSSFHYDGDANLTTNLRRLAAWSRERIAARFVGDKNKNNDAQASASTSTSSGAVLYPARADGGSPDSDSDGDGDGDGYAGPEPPAASRSSSDGGSESSGPENALCRVGAQR